MAIIDAKMMLLAIVRREAGFPITVIYEAPLYKRNLVVGFDADDKDCWWVSEK
jgi:hypothetical protein